MRLLAVLLATLACSSQDGGSRTADGPTTGTAGDERPEDRGPAKEGPPGCRTDADCTLTFIPAVEPKKAEDCCVWVCQRRVESKERADALQAAWTRTCSAVRCQQHDCPAMIDPVPVCRDGRCTSR